MPQISKYFARIFRMRNILQNTVSQISKSIQKHNQNLVNYQGWSFLQK